MKFNEIEKSIKKSLKKIKKKHYKNYFLHAFKTDKLRQLKDKKPSTLLRKTPNYK
jgi:hypothetical protein